MRVMVLVKSTKDSEAGTMSSTELLETMGKFKVQPRPCQRRCVVGRRRPPAIVSRQAGGAFDGQDRTVTDGSSAATDELVSGFWLWQVTNMDKAIEWVKRCPNPMPGPSEIESRPLFESPDFDDAMTSALVESRAQMTGSPRQTPSRVRR